MTTPSWMPPQPKLPWVEGSLDGDLPPSAVKQWGHEYALAAVEAYRKSLKPVAWMDEGLYEVLQEQGELRIGTIYTEKPNDSWLPLYRLDDQP